MTVPSMRAAYERLMEYVVIALMAVLAIEVTVGVVFRTFGAALVWYDEVASVLLAWLSFYGAALGAVKRAHIGFPGLVRSLQPPLRVPLTLFAEALVFGFFGLLAWVGWSVMDVLATDYLVSLPEISVKYTQSVIPISAMLFMIGEALVLPEMLREARGLAKTVDHTAEELTE